MTRLLLVALALALTTPVQAQSCTEGRERVGGYCCWPGQRFSSVTRTCVGEPRCPDGLAARGASCGALGVVTAGALAVPAGYGDAPAVERPSDAEPPSAPPPSLDAWPAVHEGTELHRPGAVAGRDQSLIAFALSLFDTGFVLGWIGAYADENGRACSGHTCNAWPLATLPLVGGIAATTVHIDAPGRNNGTGLAFGILSILLEAAGVVAIGIAIQNRTTERGFPRVGSPALEVSLVPSAPGALAGVSIEGVY